ncbi:neuraminidase-like domain-containing protein [Kitasatospora sp. NPDC057518]|uniref:Tc toxin subunit A-related protein n=1 Tax=Kitasatospora sp. NPDC057518 TaxID=3346155 RepID=UPI0036825E93
MSTVVRGTAAVAAGSRLGRRAAVVTGPPQSTESTILGPSSTDHRGPHRATREPGRGFGPPGEWVVDDGGAVLAFPPDLPTGPKGPAAPGPAAAGGAATGAGGEGGQGGGPGYGGRGYGGHGPGDGHGPSVADDLTVSGQVTWPEGAPVVNAVIRAVDRDLRTEQPLGPFAPGFPNETRTDAAGMYTIHYNRTQFARVELGSADLIVRVRDAAGVVVAASPTMFNAPPQAVINLVVTGPMAGQPSEWDRLAAVVEQLVDNPSPAGLGQLRMSDLEFLLGETGAAADRLTALIQAAGLVTDAVAAGVTGIPPEAFYGLIREKLPADWPGLAGHPAADFAAALQKAVNEGIAPSALAAQAAHLGDLIAQAAAHARSTTTGQAAKLADPAVRYADTRHAGGEPIVDARLDAALAGAVTALVNGAGTPSDALETALASALSSARWQDYAGVTVAAVAGAVLTGIAASPALTAEATALARTIAAQPAPGAGAVTVTDLLHLDAPVRDNPLLLGDVQQGIVVELAGLAGLSQTATGAAAAQSTGLFDAQDNTLDALRSSGAITDAEAASLSGILDLGRLTDHHTGLLHTLVSQGATAPLTLAGWDAARWTQVITATPGPLPPGTTPDAYARNLVANLEHTHPTQALAARLAPGDDHLTAVYQNNPGLDLRRLDLATGAGAAGLNWTGVPEADRPAVLGRLSAHQRLLTIGHDTATRAALARAGFDSALRIAAHTEASFIAKVTATLSPHGPGGATSAGGPHSLGGTTTGGGGLDVGTARMVYARVQDVVLNVAQAYGSARDVLNGPFAGLPVSPVTPTFVNDLLRITGLTGLFGSQDYCTCGDCQSVLSPAAYFTDLMYFTEQHVSQPYFTGPGLSTHPLYLRNRRADLWKLRLTCDNTNTLVPYLSIVDQVMEDWIQAHVLTATQPDVYAVLSDPAQKFSCQVPFSLPFAELGLYLGYFGLAVADVQQVLQLPDATVRRARTGLSPDEATVVATPDPAGIIQRLGGPATLNLLPVTDFVRRLAISRDDLTTVLAARSDPDLAQITVVKLSGGAGEIQNFPEALQNLTADRADRIHRRIRLARPLSWTLDELDLVLLSAQQAALVGGDVSEAATELVGRLLALQGELGPSVQQLCALVTDMPVSTAFPNTPTAPGARLLYETVFDLRGIFGPADPALPLNPTVGYYHYSLDTTLGTNPPVIDPKTPLLLAGLGISETDLLLLFALLKNELPFDATGHTTLNRHSLSLLYRHVLVARSLGYTVPDLITALGLVLPPPATAELNSLDRIEQLLAFHRWQAGSPLTISQLALVLTGVTGKTVGYLNNPATAAALVHGIQVSGTQPRLDALRTRLATNFNVGSARLATMLVWAAHDIAAADIQAALDAPFTGTVPDNPALLLPLLALLHQLERVALLFGTVGLQDAGIAYLTANRHVLGIADLKALTLRDVQAVAAYGAQVAAATAVTQAVDAETVVQQLLSSYDAGGTFGPADRARLAATHQVDQSLIDSIVAATSLPPVAIDALARLDQVFALCHTLGVNAYSLHKLGQDTGYPVLRDAAAVAAGAIAAQYKDDTARDAALEPYQDRVNTLKRDALCGFLVDGQPQLNFHDHNEIYDYFLLDVDMSGCARTSRVVSAISSVQLYLQRCLTGLEKSDPAGSATLVDVPPSAVPAQQWAWRRNFRVWQANRKVFLYPEAYIDPDLRDDKTPIFTDLEADLLQKPITKDTGEEAFQRYLTRLAEVAGLRICGSYYDDDQATYYFFGRTQSDPAVFHYRTWNTSTWTPWKRVDLPIEGKWVSATRFQGKLYLFWASIVTTEHTSFSGGGSHDEPSTVKVGLVYSAQKPDGTWLAPQKLDWLYPIGEPNQVWWWESFVADDMPGDKTANTPYPVISGDAIILRYMNRFLDQGADRVHDRQLNLFHNQLHNPDRWVPGTPTGHAMGLYWTFGSPVGWLGVWQSSGTDPAGFDLLREMFHTDPGAGGSSPDFVTTGFPVPDYNVYFEHGKPDFVSPIQAVNNGFPESVLAVPVHNQQYLIHDRHYLDFPRFSHFVSALLPTITEAAAGPAITAGTAGPAKEAPALPAAALVPGRSHSAPLTFNLASLRLPRALTSLPLQPLRWWWNPRQLIRLTTSIVGDLLRINADHGVEGLLALHSEYFWGLEYGVGFSITAPWALLTPDDDPAHVDIRNSAAYGTYYQELFLHLPWMMAHQLNAAGRYEEAMWWYQRLFDPTSSDTDADRNWRYVGFRGLTVPSLQDVLTDSAALDAYKNDPFNPFAIARLRPVAFQKAVVMGFVDNLIDWGDSLFAQDTTESINEATMLYVLASEILGPRPVQLGECPVVPAEQLTYDAIGPQMSNVSDFLVTLENWVYQTSLSQGDIIDTSGTHAHAHTPTATATATGLPVTTGLQLLSYGDAADLSQRNTDLAQLWSGDTLAYDLLPAFEVVNQTTLVFCVPPDDVLAGYWDRVEDRLNKIRNCMNLSGVRRQLALFAPPVNPLDLVRARAAGLSIEEAVASVQAPAAPAYRFGSVIERARQSAQTVTAFGASLLSALEKKDAEELTLLRSVHERTLLRMVEDVKTGQVQEAQHQLQALEEQKALVQARIDYYQGLIGSGLTGWEKLEADSRTAAAVVRGGESALYAMSAISFLFPNVGSPFAMTYGGREIGNSVAQAAQTLGSLGATAEAVASAAATGAGFDRRYQEWGQQLTLAEQELRQVEQQRLAAEAHAGYAQRELDVHQKQMDQADELDAFYRGKFSGLGLYTYQARTLTRLHRQAYDVAYGLAAAAQQAYAFEMGDTTSFIAPDNWESGIAGLLSGERLDLQLRQLEEAYMARNTRRLEVSQFFPLTVVDPTALVALRDTGECTFTLPELLFDVVYPGQYKRLIKSVRLTIPGVTGPYTNVAAKLSLVASEVRTAPDPAPGALVTLPVQPNIASAIATSTGLNDAGLFELNFRDERYLPFEGSGAVESVWKLELPTQLRAFDYDTISDVVLQLSYTALDDGAFRATVESRVVGELTQYATSTGLLRLFSLRHDFPAAWQQVTAAAGGGAGTVATSFEVTAQHFPYFLSARTLSLAAATVVLQPVGTGPVDASGLSLTLNGTTGSAWHVPPGTHLTTSDIAVSGPAVGTWTLAVAGPGVDPAKVADILLLVRYSAA